jgi:hypothetical protein
VYQVWEDAKVKVGPVWNVCKERFTKIYIENISHHAPQDTVLEFP